MYYFKYFRNDSYFEKTIRYNELFFASNSTLNDPMDLWFNPVLWDDIEKWKKLLEHLNYFGIYFSDYITKPQDDNFYIDINKLFCNKNLTQISENKSKIQDMVAKTIATHNLASGQDIDSAASFLIDKFCRLKDEINFLSVSFSKDPFNYLMWSHYANGFKGCLLIYDFEDGTTELKKHINGGDVLKVEMQDATYLDKISQVDLWKLIFNNVIIDNSCFISKNKHWEYERESRLVIFTQVRSAGEILHHEASLIKGIIFGSRCDKDFKERTIKALKDNRSYGEQIDFLSFDSALNDNNEIQIVSGNNHNIKTGRTKKMSHEEVVKWNNKFEYTSNDIQNVT